MKLRCKKATTEPSNGFFGIGAHGTEPIKGLTQGETYSGETINILSGGGNGSVDNSFKFLIYNDEEEWKSYNLDLFEPI